MFAYCLFIIYPWKWYLCTHKMIHIRKDSLDSLAKAKLDLVEPRFVCFLHQATIVIVTRMVKIYCNNFKGKIEPKQFAYLYLQLTSNFQWCTRLIKVRVLNLFNKHVHLISHFKIFFTLSTILFNYLLIEAPVEFTLSASSLPKEKDTAVLQS